MLASRGEAARGTEGSLTDGWDRGHHLTELQLVEDGGFTGGIKTNHENTTIHLPDELSKHFAEDTHCVVCWYEAAAAI